MKKAFKALAAIGKPKKKKGKPGRPKGSGTKKASSTKTTKAKSTGTGKRGRKSAMPPKVAALIKAIRKAGTPESKKFTVVRKVVKAPTRTSPSIIAYYKKPRSQKYARGTTGTLIWKGAGGIAHGEGARTGKKSGGAAKSKIARGKKMAKMKRGEKATPAAKPAKKKGKKAKKRAGI